MSMKTFSVSQAYDIISYHEILSSLDILSLFQAVHRLRDKPERFIHRSVPSHHYVSLEPVPLNRSRHINGHCFGQLN